MKKQVSRFADGKRKPILLAPLESEHQKIRVASAIAGLPMSHFLLQHGLTAAEKIIEKNNK